MAAALLWGILGFALIIVAANELVKGAAYLARAFDISPIIIGLTVVALGTSAPEIVVSIIAAIQNKSDLAVANAIGSNIANIGLVLGLCALLRPIKLNQDVIAQDLPILFIIMIIVFLLLADGYFSFGEGLVLLICLCGLLTFITYQMSTSSYHMDDDELAQQSEASYPVIRCIVGLLLLPISAHLIVSSSVTIAAFLGVSEAVIGVTIVAMGTSLPEVATSLVGIFRQEDEIALGNIIGSNMFNMLAVLPFVGLINPSMVSSEIRFRDVPIMLLLTTLLALLILRRRDKLSKGSGLLLCLAYVLYILSIVAGIHLA